MDTIIKVSKLNTQTIDYINKHYKNSAQPTIIEIQNTKNVSSSLLEMLDPSIKIRVVGGYKENLLKLKSFKDSFSNATTYTRNELVQIVRKMEEIEKDILPSWSQIQKTVYIFDKLKSYIIYDKDYETKDRIDGKKADIEMRSLRAMISRKCVCAGYALIMKEMLDRQGIENELAIGGNKNNPGSHAWVIAKINNRKFPIDLTWDAGIYREGIKSNSHSYFANINKFIESHIPDMGNETMDYERELSGLNQEFVKRISAPLSRAENYPVTTFKLTRENGNDAYISQMGNRIIDGKKMYEYAYKDSRHAAPVILCCEENVAGLIKKQDKGLEKSEVAKLDCIIGNMFSESNIEDSLRSHSNYLGVTIPISNGFSILKNRNLINEIKTKMRIFTRNDGSSFVLRQGPQYVVNGKNVNSYDCVELVTNSERKIFQKNTIFSEENLLGNTSPGLSSEFLSRERIDRLSLKNGGYIGRYHNGRCLYDKEVQDIFKLNRTNWGKDDIEKCSKYTPEKYTFTRSDGTNFSLTRMHKNPRAIHNQHLVQYRYEEEVPKKNGGVLHRKKYIFAQDDLVDIMKKQSVVDYDFSRTKMSDDNLLLTGRYIGIWNDEKNKFDLNLKIAKFFTQNNGIDFTEKKYGEKIKRIYNRDTRTKKRSDGTSFKLREIQPEKEIEIYGKRIHQYEYVEDIKVANWLRERKRHMLFSEEDLLKENRPEVIDYLLSQKRIEKQVNEAGGYLGYYNEKGKRIVLDKRREFFKRYPRDFTIFPDSYTINQEELDEKKNIMEGEINSKNDEKILER